MLFCLLKKTMKLKFLIFNFSFLILTACGAQKPVATTSHERIETKMQPIVLPTDSVVVVLASPTPQPVKILSFEASRPARISHSCFDTLQRIKIDLKPDTVFVPYTNHIRSDTIVVPDRVCQQKLNRSNMTNLFLILILIAIFIFLFKQKYKFSR